MSDFCIFTGFQNVGLMIEQDRSSLAVNDTKILNDITTPLIATLMIFHTDY